MTTPAPPIEDVERQVAWSNFIALLASNPYLPTIPHPLAICRQWSMFIDPFLLRAYYYDNETKASCWSPPPAWDDELATMAPLTTFVVPSEDRNQPPQKWLVFRDPEYLLQYFIDAHSGFATWYPPEFLHDQIKEAEGATVDWNEDFPFPERDSLDDSSSKDSQSRRASTLGDPPTLVIKTLLHTLPWIRSTPDPKEQACFGYANGWGVYQSRDFGTYGLLYYHFAADNNTQWEVPAALLRASLSEWTEGPPPHAFEDSTLSNSQSSVLDVTGMDEAQNATRMESPSIAQALVLPLQDSLPEGGEGPSVAAQSPANPEPGTTTAPDTAQDAASSMQPQPSPSPIEHARPSIPSIVQAQEPNSTGSGAGDALGATNRLSQTFSPPPPMRKSTGLTAGSQSQHAASQRAGGSTSTNGNAAHPNHTTTSSLFSANAASAASSNSASTPATTQVRVTQSDGSGFAFQPSKIRPPTRVVLPDTDFSMSELLSQLRSSAPASKPPPLEDGQIGAEARNDRLGASLTRGLLQGLVGGMDVPVTYKDKIKQNQRLSSTITAEDLAKIQDMNKSTSPTVGSQESPTEKVTVQVHEETKAESPQEKPTVTMATAASVVSAGSQAASPLHSDREVIVLPHSPSARSTTLSDAVDSPGMPSSLMRLAEICGKDVQSLQVAAASKQNPGRFGGNLGNGGTLDGPVDGSEGGLGDDREQDYSALADSMCEDLDAEIEALQRRVDAAGRGGRFPNGGGLNGGDSEYSDLTPEARERLLAELEEKRRIRSRILAWKTNERLKYQSYMDRHNEMLARAAAERVAQLDEKRRLVAMEREKRRTAKDRAHGSVAEAKRMEAQRVREAMLAERESARRHEEHMRRLQEQRRERAQNIALARQRNLRAPIGQQHGSGSGEGGAHALDRGNDSVWDNQSVRSAARNPAGGPSLRSRLQALQTESPTAGVAASQPDGNTSMGSGSKSHSTRQTSMRRSRVDSLASQSSRTNSRTNSVRDLPKDTTPPHPLAPGRDRSSSRDPFLRSTVVPDFDLSPVLPPSNSNFVPMAVAAGVVEKPRPRQSPYSVSPVPARTRSVSRSHSKSRTLSSSHSDPAADLPTARTPVANSGANSKNNSPSNATKDSKKGGKPASTNSPSLDAAGPNANTNPDADTITTTTATALPPVQVSKRSLRTSSNASLDAKSTLIPFASSGGSGSRAGSRVPSAGASLDDGTLTAQSRIPRIRSRNNSRGNPAATGDALGSTSTFLVDRLIDPPVGVGLDGVRALSRLSQSRLQDAATTQDQGAVVEPPNV